MRVVLDASVAVKWVIRDPGAESNLDKAWALLEAIRARTIEAVEPPHWTIETLAVIARMRPRRVAFVLGLLGALPVGVTSGLSCQRRAAEIAIALNHHLFDTLYHAVALEEGATLVTADEAISARPETSAVSFPLRTSPSDDRSPPNGRRNGRCRPGGTQIA